MSEERRAIHLAVLDPVSLLAKELSRVLGQGEVPLGEVHLAGDDALAGTVAEFAGEAGVVRPLVPEDLEACDGLIACGCTDRLRASQPWLAKQDLAVLDLTGTLATTPRWLRARHPAAVTAARILAPLGEAFGMVGAQVTAFEPAAAYGSPGIDELYEQSRALLAFASPPRDVLEACLAFNLTPEPLGRTQGLENRVSEEIQRSLGEAEAPVRVSILRAPVFLGLALLIDVELDDEAAATRDVLAETPGLEVVAEAASPGALPEESTGLTAVCLLEAPAGRLRLWAVTDYLRAAVTDAVMWLERRGWE